MSKEFRQKCPNCLGTDIFGTLIGEKGDGFCSNCDGTGKKSDVIRGLMGPILDFDTEEPCSICNNTGQCQTCGGTGYQYYDEYEKIDESSPYSYNEEHNSSSYSSEGYYTSSNYRTYDNQKSSVDSSLLTVLGWIVVIIIGTLIFDNTCGNNNSKEHNVINTSAICADCNGAGILEINENCQYCSGRGNLECKVCNSMKTYTCDNCRRVGLIRCPQCERTVNRGYIDCKQCIGKGYILDDNTQITCPTCRGQRVCKCEQCQGSGQLNCPKCNGNGYLDCKNCKGLGNLKCSHCSGNGIIYSTYTCQRCTGKRTLIKSSSSN